MRLTRQRSCPACCSTGRRTRRRAQDAPRLDDVPLDDLHGRDVLEDRERQDEIGRRVVGSARATLRHRGRTSRARAARPGRHARASRTRCPGRSRARSGRPSARVLRPRPQPISTASPSARTGSVPRAPRRRSVWPVSKNRSRVGVVVAQARVDVPRPRSVARVRSSTAASTRPSSDERAQDPRMTVCRRPHARTQRNGALCAGAYPAEKTGRCAPAPCGRPRPVLRSSSRPVTPRFEMTSRDPEQRRRAGVRVVQGRRCPGGKLRPIMRAAGGTALTFREPAPDPEALIGLAAPPTDIRRGRHTRSTRSSPATRGSVVRPSTPIRRARRTGPCGRDNSPTASRRRGRGRSRHVPGKRPSTPEGFLQPERPGQSSRRAHRSRDGRVS